MAAQAGHDRASNASARARRKCANVCVCVQFVCVCAVCVCRCVRTRDRRASSSRHRAASRSRRSHRAHGDTIRPEISDHEADAGAAKTSTVLLGDPEPDDGNTRRRPSSIAARQTRQQRTGTANRIHGHGPCWWCKSRTSGRHRYACTHMRASTASRRLHSQRGSMEQPAGTASHARPPMRSRSCAIAADEGAKLRRKESNPRKHRNIH